MPKFIYLTAFISLVLSASASALPNNRVYHLVAADSNWLCYGYYKTNDSQKVQATFVINHWLGLTGADKVEYLQYSIGVLQGDSIVECFGPTDIKSYTIEDWGRVKFFPAPKANIRDTFEVARAVSFTKHAQTFESVEICPGVNGYAHYGTARGFYFLNVSEKGKYLDKYYWWGGTGYRGRKPVYPCLKMVYYNKATQKAYAYEFSSQLSDFFSDSPMLSSLTASKNIQDDEYVLNDTDIIFKEYQRWRWKHDCINNPGSANSIVFSFYPNRNSDTSYTMKALFDANIKYGHRGIATVSFVISVATCGLGMIPYYQIVKHHAIHYTKNSSLNQQLMLNKYYTAVYKRAVGEVRNTRMYSGGILGVAMSLLVFFALSRNGQ